MEAAELALVGLAGSGIGTALGVPMVWRRSDIRLMGGALLALSALASIVSARLLAWLPATAAVEHAVNLLGLTAYPLVYLWVRGQTRRRAAATSAWWVWLPGAAYAAALAIRGLLGMSTRVPFAWLLPVVLSFTLACAAELPRCRGSHPHELLKPAWVVSFLALLNLAQVARMSFGGVAPVRALVPLVAALGFAAIVGVLAWRSAGRASNASAPRYERSGLDADSAAALLARVERALAADRLFADAGLTLGRLAAAVDSTPQQISEAMNRYLKVTFHELLNRHRVEEVKARLREPSADGYTVEGIGAEAGFGSRSALYAAFGRLEGMTPAEYRRRSRPPTR